MRCKSLAIIVFLGVFFPQEIAWTRTNDMKQPCANCHTMHNSQGGNPVFGVVQQPALLTNTCYGCHSDGQAFTDKPVVWHVVTANYGTDTLAGGDFNWAVNNPLKGHDVEGIALTQDPPRAAPGDPALKQYSASNPLTCAGSNGCHGNFSATSDILAMYQTHHAPETAQPMDGTSLQRSYRLLHGVDGYIAGYEDSDYEFTRSAADHNQYKGVARSADTNDATSISHSCAVCHGDFHSGAGDAGIAGASFASPWLRHPVDYAMALTGEYGGYGGAGNAYNVATPLGSNDVTTRKSVVSGVGNAIIVCVTCHRAHGSPYDYSLRWNYLGWPAAAGSNGCGDCHTAKN